MNIQITEVQAKTILTPQKVGSLASSYDFSLNPYAGCAFACSYCYVPKFPNGRHEITEWGGWVEVKVNAPQLIQKERLKVYGSRIFFSSATDPYQYLELKYRLSRRCLQELLRYRPAKVTMHTRSHLILQDLELLQAFGDTLQVGVSITTDDDEVRAEFEPSAPSIQRRLGLIASLNSAGIAVYASLSPLLPCNPYNLVKLIKPHVQNLWLDEMRWLDINRRPDLIKKYCHFFEESTYSETRSLIRSAFAAARSSGPRRLCTQVAPKDTPPGEQPNFSWVEAMGDY